MAAVKIHYHSFVVTVAFGHYYYSPSHRLRVYKLCVPYYVYGITKFASIVILFDEGFEGKSVVRIENGIETNSLPLFSFSLFPYISFRFFSYL